MLRQYVNASAGSLTSTLGIHTSSHIQRDKQSISLYKVSSGSMPINGQHIKCTKSGNFGNIQLQDLQLTSVNVEWFRLYKYWLTRAHKPGENIIQ